MKESHVKWAVVGGGISGIAAAYFLRERGVNAEIIEKDATLGGRIGSGRIGPRSIDFGGKNIGRHYKLFRDFSRSLGDYTYEPFGINSSRVRNGKIVTLDSSRRFRSTFNFLRDCPKRDVLLLAYLCAHVLINKNNRYLGSRFFSALGERHDKTPLDMIFSRHFCNAAVRPMSVRMNGAEPDEIYLGNFGTNIGMWLDSYDQLQSGMSTLLDAFQHTARLLLGTRVDQLLMQNNRIAGLRLTHADGTTEEREYDNVILATPACVTADLVRHVDASLADALSRIKYYPVMVAIAEYQRDIFSPEVRALVFGPQDPLSNAGAYGVTCRNIVRYTFSGRAARAMIEEGISPECFIELGETTLNRYIPVKANERRAFVSRLFDPGLCAYGPYHARILDAIDHASRSICNLFITGDYIRGASIEACMQASKATVTRGAAVLPTDARSNPSASTCEPRASTY